MYKKILLKLIIVLSFTYPVLGNEDLTNRKQRSAEERYREYLDIINGNPEALQKRRERVKAITQRLNEIEAKEKGYISKPYTPPICLFQRAWLCACKHQDYQKSLKVFDILQAKKEFKITFNSNTLYPFDKAGTCSAMALDFLARYIHECAQEPSSPVCRKKIQDFGPFYAADSSSFKSVQAAFNTIVVTKPIQPLTLGHISHHKMQSLANYHNLSLKPVCPLLKDSQLDYKIKNILKSLPNGAYIIRGIVYKNNHKLEDFGHTMGLIKRKDLVIFFDNSAGAYELSLSEIAAEIADWEFDYTRIYEVTTKPGGSKNLSNEVIHSHGNNCFKIPDFYDFY